MPILYLVSDLLLALDTNVVFSSGQSFIFYIFVYMLQFVFSDLVFIQIFFALKA